MHVGLKAVLVVTIAITIFINETHGACTCGASSAGTDYCTCQGGQARIPRPRPRPQPISISTTGSGSGSGSGQSTGQFKAIGDTCSCGSSTVVQPAQPPRPAYTSFDLEPRQQAACQEERTRAPESYQGPHVHPDAVYGNKPQHRPLIADAVSVSLAYQLARNLRRPVPEDKIQYGFRVQPVNGEVTRTHVNVPEERLSALNRAVVELRHASVQSNNDDDDDDDEEAAQEARSPGYLTYGDIGYCPESYPTRTFESTRSSSSSSSSQNEECTNRETGADRSCGFQPGRIGVQAQDLHSDHFGLEDCLEKK